jgi:type IV pilus assembly protein PilE
MSARSAARGFTLIELMITVVIVGILASLAWPSFVEFVRKGRRADAVAALTLVQQSEERWRANNAQYSDTLGQLNVPSTTASGYYSLALSRVSATGFVATATVTSTGLQASDSSCHVLTLTVANGDTSYSSTDSTGNIDSGSSNRCWNR